MDFHDDDFYTQNTRSRGKRSGFLSGLMGALIGGLIVLLLVPSFVNYGIIKITPGQSDNALPIEENQEKNNPPEGKQVNVNVNSAIVEAVDKVKPAVVGVVNIQEQNSLWNRASRDVEAGVGSGVVFDKREGKAYIVTNNHVVEDAKDLEVALADGERVKAELEGADSLTDLAVITVDADKVEAVANFGESINLRSGEPAIAIGNPLGLEFSQTTTVGVVSSANRTINKDLDGDGRADWETEVIQTDAAINPGNSGGALVNIEGDIIGINSAKIAETGVEGLGFAIPISDARPIIDQLIAFGKVKRAYMGITPVDLHGVSKQDRANVLQLPDKVNDGVVLYEVSKFGPSALAGLKRLDVIVKLDQQTITNSSDLRKYLYKEKKVGEKMKVTFYREGKLKSIEMTLTEFPDPNEQNGR